MTAPGSDSTKVMCEIRYVELGSVFGCVLRRWLPWPDLSGAAGDSQEDRRGRSGAELRNVRAPSRQR
jgi:hypothetical protein